MAAVQAIGLMSGTSLDGVDVAVIETDGERVSAFGPTGYRAYTEGERALLREALTDAVAMRERTERPGALAQAEALVTRAHGDAIEDFLKIEDFSYGCKQVFSADRWCLTGEAGAFLDPLYSPGSDFIALSNTFITDLIARELEGDDVSARVPAYESTYFRLFETTLADYLGQYHLFGDPQVMCVKLHWDYTYYWSYPALWFFHRKWIDLDFVEKARPEFDRAVQLHLRMQQLFRQWHMLDGREHSDSFVTLFPHLIQISDELDDEFDDEALLVKATRDREAMEAFAITVFEKAARLLPDVTVDLQKPVNPYAVGLDPARWEEDGLFDGSGMSPREARKLVKGLQFAWLDEFGGKPTAVA